MPEGDTASTVRSRNAAAQFSEQPAFCLGLDPKTLNPNPKAPHSPEARQPSGMDNKPKAWGFNECHR